MCLCSVPSAEAARLAACLLNGLRLWGLKLNCLWYNYDTSVSENTLQGHVQMHVRRQPEEVWPDASGDDVLPGGCQVCVCTLYPVIYRL